MSLTYPIIWWGAADDLSTYTQEGTCVVTGGQVDMFNGTTATQLSDGSGATRGGRYKEYTAAYSGWHVATVCVKQSGTDPTTAVKIENVTLADQSTVTFAWAAGVPTPSYLGSGAHYAPVALNSGWYAQRLYVQATAGNTMRLHLYPSSTNVADLTAGYFYVRNVALLDCFGNPVAWEESRPGSLWDQGGSGVEDAWIQGTDYHFSAEIPWVPQIDRDWPVSVSGWNGPLETTGVNCGMAAMLRAGRNREILSLYEDRSTMAGGAGGAATYGVDSYLVEPMAGAPTLQGDGSRSFRLELRNATKPYKPYALT